jgi:hypothetical protein
VDPAGSGLCSVAKFCEHSNVPSVFTKSGEFTDQLRDYQFLCAMQFYLANSQFYLAYSSSLKNVQVSDLHVQYKWRHILPFHY